MCNETISDQALVQLAKSAFALERCILAVYLTAYGLKTGHVLHYSFLMK